MGVNERECKHHSDDGNVHTKAPVREAQWAQAAKSAGQQTSVDLGGGQSVYLPQDALVMAGAEGGDDTHALRVSVEPVLTHAAFSGAAAVDRGQGVNVPTASLTQQGFF